MVGWVAVAVVERTSESWSERSHCSEEPPLLLGCRMCGWVVAWEVTHGGGAVITFIFTAGPASHCSSTAATAAHPHSLLIAK